MDSTKKPALPPRPDSSCSQTSSVTYLSRISQLELVIQELETQLQVSLTENMKLKEQLKYFTTEEVKWKQADKLIQELRREVESLTVSNATLNSSIFTQQTQRMGGEGRGTVSTHHMKSRSLAVTEYQTQRDAIASVSVHLRDIHPVLTEASTDDHHPLPSLTDFSQHSLLMKAIPRGRRDIENFKPGSRNRTGSAGKLAKYTPFSVRMVKRSLDMPEMHVNIPKVSEVRQGNRKKRENL